MDHYKKTVKNKETRIKILEFLSFIPDSTMVKIQYKIKTGRKVNLKNPQRFTEKLQWIKLNYRDDLITQCSDKFAVRKYVEAKGFPNILVPLLGVYNNVDDIDVTKLPEKFVLKITNGTHSNIFCEDKDNFDFDIARIELQTLLDRKSISPGREWGYHNIIPKIICETYMEKDSNNDLIDYKFFCFNGKAYCLYVITERYTNGARLGIYDLNFNRLPYNRADIPPIVNEIEKPENFDQMIEIAETLSKDFPHVRVDLYNVKGKIYFGELTFYDASGYQSYIPDEFDILLGHRLQL